MWQVHEVPLVELNDDLSIYCRKTLPALQFPFHPHGDQGAMFRLIWPQKKLHCIAFSGLDPGDPAPDVQSGSARTCPLMQYLKCGSTWRCVLTRQRESKCITTHYTISWIYQYQAAVPKNETFPSLNPIFHKIPNAGEIKQKLLGATEHKPSKINEEIKTGDPFGQN